MSAATGWMQPALPKDSQALATQSCARTLSAQESALAEALESLFAKGIPDFGEIAKQLALQDIEVPGQQHSQWTSALLSSTLARINAELDDAYARDGFGA